MEKWQEENEKLLAIKNKILDSGRASANQDEMAEMLLQIYNSANALNGKITPLGLFTLAEIQYSLRSPASQAKHDKQVKAEMATMAIKAKPSNLSDNSYIAWQLINNSDVPGGATGDRIGKLTEIIGRLTDEELSRLRIETCTHGGGDPERYGKVRKREGRAIKIGHAGRHSGGKEIQIWAVWS